MKSPRRGRLQYRFHSEVCSVLEHPEPSLNRLVPHGFFDPRVSKRSPRSRVLSSRQFAAARRTKAVSHVADTSPFLRHWAVNFSRHPQLSSTVVSLKAEAGWIGNTSPAVSWAVEVCIRLHYSIDPHSLFEGIRDSFLDSFEGMAPGRSHHDRTRDRALPRQTGLVPMSVQQRLQRRNVG